MIYDSALPRNAKVSSIISNGQWTWPVANSPDLLILKQAIPITMAPMISSRDEVVWTSSRLGSFSIKEAWHSLRARHSLVAWHKLVWFPKAIPKCGFILWLAIRERLGTCDRAFLDTSSRDCLLCNRNGESHDHLFFNCSYSKVIWRNLKQKCGIHLGDSSWADCISQMVVLCKGKSLTSTIRKLCLATGVYFLWEERNKRYHDNSYREVGALLWSITDFIRYRLSSLSGIKDIDENRILQSTWSLPDSIFL